MLTPEERGPQAAWAYASRDLLGISPEQVVELLGRYNPATIRKAETNDRHMSRPIWRALTALYPRLAHERGIAIPIPPLVATGTRGGTSDQTALIAAISTLVEELRLSRLEQAAWNQGVQETLAQLGSRGFAAPTGDPAGEPREVAPR